MQSLLAGQTIIALWKDFRDGNTKGTLSGGTCRARSNRTDLCLMTDRDGASRKKKEKSHSESCGILSGMIMEQVTHKYVFGVNFSLASPFRLTLHFCVSTLGTQTRLASSLKTHLFTCAEGLWEIRSKVTGYLAAQEP